MLPFAKQPLAFRLAVAVFAFAGGAVIGVIATATHQLLRPWGAILCLLVVAAVLAGLRLVTAGRLVPTAAAIGLLGAIAVLALPGAGGSVLFPANAAGYLWTFGPTVIAFVILAWPRLTRHPAGRIEQQPRAKDPSTP